MNFRSIGAWSAAFFVVSMCGAEGADFHPLIAPVYVAPPTFTWTGIYAGGFFGGGSGTSNFHDPFGSSLYGDTVRTPFAQGGGQIGATYQVPSSRVVIGIEADGGAVDLDGTNTCIAYNGNIVPFNCRVHASAMATGAGRLGYAFGTEGHTLGYLKGGVAVLFEERDLVSGNTEFARSANFPRAPFATYDTTPQVGFTVGAGVEQALSNAWSLKIEYDYADFGTSAIAIPRTFQRIAGTPAAFGPVAAGRTSSDQSLHELKVGLNYHFGAAGTAPFASGFLGSTALPNFTPTPLSPYGVAQTYAIEAGARYWYSFGRFQRDLGPRAFENSLISRLTYQSTSSSGETFGRIDTPARVFVKGLVGAGDDTSGHGNDEDFIFTHNPGTPQRYSVPYQNGQQPQLKGDLDYATVDIGYSVLKSGQTNVGGFVGYNYYRSDEDTFGCMQIANRAGGCVPSQAPGPMPRLIQNEHFNSVRLGVNGQMWIDRLRLEADAAYLPFVGFNGTDVHPDRFDVPNQVSTEFGRGQGVQLELLASYYVTPSLSLGIGGRYWGFLVPNATVANFGTTILADGVHAERYGLTAQLGYRFSSVGPDAIVARY